MIDIGSRIVEVMGLARDPGVDWMNRWRGTSSMPKMDFSAESGT